MCRGTRHFASNRLAYACGGPHMPGCAAAAATHLLRINATVGNLHCKIPCSVKIILLRSACSLAMRIFAQAARRCWGLVAAIRAEGGLF